MSDLSKSSSATSVCCSSDVRQSVAQDPSVWRYQYRHKILHAILVTRTIVAPYCVICAGPVGPLALTNTCLHQFCFECIAQWTTITPECPLCKCSYQTVIYDVRSVDEYKELQIPNICRNMVGQPL